MQPAIRNIRTVVLSVVLFVLAVMVQVMHTPDPARTSDLHRAMSEKIVAQAESAVETCHLIVPCEMPPFAGDSLQISVGDLPRKPAFPDSYHIATSISPEAQLPPPRV